jgi:hypothetical protein
VDHTWQNPNRISAAQGPVVTVTAVRRRALMIKGDGDEPNSFGVPVPSSGANSTAITITITITITAQQGVDDQADPVNNFRPSGKP